MKLMSAICLGVLLLPTPGLCGTDEYSDVRESYESSATSAMQSQVLREYFNKSNGKVDEATVRKKRQGAEELHRKTFGDGQNAEVWGTRSSE
ncbi:hypothetical protein [Pseudodesulfovibrio piezophilus]|uniref:hypothetical protein n=1 Tax=Pseudodesulfovibrio piezophilus TaxID=879567 RepID=UPI0005A06522|nr:hypothetical protein [Pseudodesulfovibrio piezophilus]